MFNLRKMVQAWGRFFGVVLPLLLAVVILSLITELHVHHISLSAFLAAPERAREFWPAIVRNVIPSLVVMLIANWLAARFVLSLYRLQKLKQGFDFLWRWRFGQARFAPYLLIEKGEISKDKDKVLTRIGGPGNLVIYHDSAVVLERAGCLTRVEPSDFVPVEAFEKVYKIIDLRPKRKTYEVKAMTREGIRVTCEVDLRYQIKGRRDKEPTERLPYPMLRWEVLKAATCTWKCEPLPGVIEDEELDWEKLVILAHVETILRSVLARYPLDQLIGPAGWEENEPHPRQEIREELERRLRSGVRELGVEILSVNLGNIVVQDEVTEQWIAAWKAKWERQMMQRRAEGEAEYVAQVETAKAQAQAEMILELTQTLRSLVADDGALRGRLGLLRIIAMLRHVSHDPWTHSFLPERTMSALTALQDVIAGTERQQGF
jgi:regulator of protease activity HflC (stomatin/prohibitin superfamily)